MTGTTTSNLTLANLVEGTYTFTLTVYDKKDQTGTASTTVTVRPAEKGPPKAVAGLFIVVVEWLSCSSKKCKV